MHTRPPLLLDYCLYFTANSLARAMTRMAEEEFGSLGIAPSHAYLLMRVNDIPGISQKDLAAQLSLAPSTVTRFIDELERKGYLTRQVDGKVSHVRLTKEGVQLQEKIVAAWYGLYVRYSRALGEEQGHQLTQMIKEATRKLES